MYEHLKKTDTSCEAPARKFIKELGGGEAPRTVDEVAQHPMAGFDSDYQYEVLDSYHFKDARSFGSGWNVMCVKQIKRRDVSDIHHVLVFEGTSSIINDWIWDLRTLDDDYHMDWGLVNAMNSRILEWMNRYSISKFGAHIGHSAGAVFAKACGRFGEHHNESYDRQDVYLITFNGYDPFHEWGRLHLDFRAEGDIVSACLGAHKVFTVDTLGDARNIVEAHSLPEMDFSGVNYNTLDAHTENRFGFKTTHKPSGKLNGANAAVMSSPKDHAHQCFALMGQLTASAAARFIIGMPNLDQSINIYHSLKNQLPTPD